MTFIAIAYHAASDDEVSVLSVQNGTATVATHGGTADDGQPLEYVYELPYQDLSRIIVNGAVIDNFGEVASVFGVSRSQDMVELFTQTPKWAMLVATSFCSR